MRPITTLLATATCLAALSTTACASDDDDNNSRSSTASSSATPTATAARATSAASHVSQAVRAVKTAKREVRGGRPYDLETERFRGKRVWEVKVAKGTERPHKIYVSADGRRIERHTRARTRGDDAPKARKATISLAKALRTADRHARGRLDEAEIDRTRDGRIVWSVTFERSGDAETEVTIDARTGKVTRVEHDDD